VAEQSDGACVVTTAITRILGSSIATTTATSTTSGVYCPETEGVYLIPIIELPMRRQGNLRFEPAKNNQRKFIRHAAQYEIGRVKVHAPDYSIQLGRVDEGVG
jgi:hypothetical protein